MKKSRIGLALGTCLLALSLGWTLHQIWPTSKAIQTVQLGSLPERHLQPPWWTTVSLTRSATTSTYVVPAAVLFPSTSSVIGESGKQVLAELVAQLHGASSVTIVGCTDWYGGADSPYNLALGQQRADAAASVLELDGLPSSVVHATSWADTHPVTDAGGLDQATLAALDRRVVLIVTKQEA